MKPHDQPLGCVRHERALSRLWDALQNSGTLGDPSIESEDLATITLIHNVEDAPSPDDEMINRMWISIVEATPTLQGHAVTIFQANGHGPITTDNPLLQATETVGDIGPQRLPARRGTLDSLNVWVRILAIAAVSGFFAGALTLGGGGRIAMRVAAMLSADELQGARTENLETVGSMSLAGSFNLLMTGGVVGIALGIGYLAIRRWLPKLGWQRNLTSGIVFFSICGFVALDSGGNGDYERFGIAGLNICLFTLLPFLFGLAIAPMVEKLDRTTPKGLLTLAKSPSILLKIPAIALTLIVATTGAMMLLALTPLQLFVLLPATTSSFRYIATRFPIFASPSDNPWLGRLALIVPCVIGLLFTVFAVGRII